MLIASQLIAQGKKGELTFRRESSKLKSGKIYTEVSLSSSTNSKSRCTTCYVSYGNVQDSIYRFITLTFPQKIEQIIKPQMAELFITIRPNTNGKIVDAAIGWTSSDALELFSKEEISVIFKYILNQKVVIERTEPKLQEGDCQKITFPIK